MSRFGLEIRAATSADAPGLAELLGVTPTAMADRLATMNDEPGTVLLALEWGPPSGVIAVHWFQTLLAPRRTASISTLLVGPEQRRRGIARLLLKSAAQAARSAGCTTLDIAGDETANGLAPFCLATGFTAAGDRFARPLRRQTT